MFRVGHPDDYESRKEEIKKETVIIDEKEVVTYWYKEEWLRKHGVNWFPSEELLNKKSDNDKDSLAILSDAAKQLYRHLNSPTLSTEQRAPETIGMAEAVQDDGKVSDAIIMCTNVDKRALTQLKTYLSSDKFNAFISAIKKTIESGGKIYFSGCGSSGRLGLLLEKILREKFPEYQKQFVSIIGGGDFALVSAIERFEDNKDYAIQQLEQQGFELGKDLLIGNSASANATFVNAQINHAAEETVPKYLKPWLICCNDNKALEVTKKNTDKQHPIVKNPEKMNILSLDVGANALSGSSRMQSATVTQLAIYFAIIQGLKSESDCEKQLDLLLGLLKEAKLEDTLQGLIIAESACYDNGDRIIRKIDPKLGITAFTDGTELAPTFSMNPIENLLLGTCTDEKASWIIPSIIGAETQEEAFKLIIGREPYSLNWEHEPKTMPDKLAGFDFSEYAAKTRQQYLDKKRQQIEFEIKLSEDENQLILNLNHGQIKKTFDLTGLDPLCKQTFVKIILNTLSTLVMGRQRKYTSNLMRNVAVSNAKLFARVLRYVKDELANNFPDFKKLLRIPGAVSPIEEVIALIIADVKLQNMSYESIVAEVMKVIKKNINMPGAEIAPIQEKQTIKSVINKSDVVENDSEGDKGRAPNDFGLFKRRLNKELQFKVEFNQLGAKIMGMKR